MVLARLEIQLVALSMALIASAVSVRIGGLMELVLSSNATKMIWNLACLISDCKMAGSHCGLFLTGVVSFGEESNVRTDWLLAMTETTTNEIVGAATFDLRRWVCTSVMESSSSLLVRPSLWISAVLVHCWSFFKGGRSAAAVGLIRTVSANGLDHATRSLPQSGPVVLEILRKALPMLLLERLPLMAMSHRGEGRWLVA